MPVHFNIQQDCGHFVASVPSSMLTSPDAHKDPLSALPSHPPAQEQDCVVVITREVPHQTASDFVRDLAASHSLSRRFTSGGCVSCSCSSATGWST